MHLHVLHFTFLVIFLKRSPFLNAFSCIQEQFVWQVEICSSVFSVTIVHMPWGSYWGGGVLKLICDANKKLSNKPVLCNVPWKVHQVTVWQTSCSVGTRTFHTCRNCSFDKRFSQYNTSSKLHSEGLESHSVRSLGLLPGDCMVWLTRQGRPVLDFWPALGHLRGMNIYASVFSALMPHLLFPERSCSHMTIPRKYYILNNVFTRLKCVSIKTGRSLKTFEMETNESVLCQNLIFRLIKWKKKTNKEKREKQKSFSG